MKRAGAAPGSGALTALAGGQAGDGGLLAPGGGEGDGSARTPHEVPGVRGDDEGGTWWGGRRVGVRHGKDLPFRRSTAGGGPPVGALASMDGYAPAPASRARRVSR
ncbi:hypothetical protein Scel_01400 [Streptomyces cellostaticus]|nr:hypothetical protein Scel_01400 [Streptomyces cellostaticus]